MQRQLDKVQLFTDWSGMQLAPSKCETSAVLWGTHASHQSAAKDWSAIKPVLEQLRVCGAPIKCIPPEQPFRYLGPLLTLTMDWKPNMHKLLDIIATKGHAIACSPGTIQQKLEMERCCTVGTLAYHFAIAPFSHAQIRTLDVARAKVLKRILKLPNSAPSDMLYLPHSRFGCGFVSLLPVYAQVCADTLVTCLNDMGRLGTVARAVLHAQMSRKRVTSLQDAPASWMTSNTHMQLRKASILTQHAMHVRYQRGWDPDLHIIDLYELCTMSVAAKGLSSPLSLLQDQVIRPLCQAFRYTCQPFQTDSGMMPLTAMHAKNPSCLIALTVQRAYTILLQICCSPTCRLRELLHAPGLAPEPPQYRPFKGCHVSSQPMLPAGCPVDLPSFMELSHIMQFSPHVPSQPTSGCYYKVAWCTGPRPSASRLQRLQAFGIVPQPLQLDTYSQHMCWQPSILHWSVVKYFWPGKLAAFEARQLHSVLSHNMTSSNGIDARDCFHSAQRQAQHISTSNIIPAFSTSSNTIEFGFVAVNPDRDVRSSGSCMLARNSSGSIAVYDAAGAWVVDLSNDCILSLASRVSLDALQASTFSTIVRSIMHVPLQDSRDASAMGLFKQQFCLPASLMKSLQALFGITYEWFASPVNLHGHIPMYASKSAGDHIASSMGDAYAFKWLHSGFANPGLNHAQALAAVRWAIASCYEPAPVLNLLVVPITPRTSALQATLAHACAQHLLSMPAGTCHFSVPEFLHAHCLVRDRLPMPAVEVVLIANHSGISRFMAQHSLTYSRLRRALQRSSASACTVHLLRDVPEMLPVLSFRLPWRWRHAQHPPLCSDIPAVCSQALAEIQDGPPPLLMDAASIVYTDGSKRGTSITAAWVHPAGSQSGVVTLPGPLQAQSTPLRGELAAIYEAVHSSDFPLYRRLTLMTDSLTALYLIHAYIRTPTLLRFHKHRWLVAAIAQNLLSRTAHVCLLKVKAHIGVCGNEAADRLAAQAHDMHDAPASSFADPQDRQPAWVQFWFGEALSDLDTLRSHALSRAEMSYVQAVLRRPEGQHSKALHKVLSADGHDAGLHSASSNAFWTACRVTDWQRSLAMRVRFNILPTRRRIALWYPSRHLPESCPLCMFPKDTIGHRLGSCTHPPVKRQICARHGHAVQAFASEIRNGMLAKCAMLVDAECHERYTSFPPAFLPVELQCSRPDIILVQNALCSFADMPVHYRRDPRLTVHVVEVGYTSDYLLHERRRTKLEQHAQLCRNLASYGWVNVRMHAFVVGHTGVMLADNASAMTSLGVSPARVGPFLADLAITSLRKSCAILSCFPTAHVEPVRPDAVHVAPLPEAPSPEQPPSPPHIVQHSLQSNDPHMSSLVPASPTPPHVEYDVQSSTLPNSQSTSEHLSQSHASLLSMSSLQPPSQPLVLRTSDLPAPQSMMNHEPLQPTAQPIHPPPSLHPSQLPPVKRARITRSVSQTPLSTLHARASRAMPSHTPGSARGREGCPSSTARIAMEPDIHDSTLDVASIASPSSFTFDPGG